MLSQTISWLERIIVHYVFKSIMRSLIKLSENFTLPHWITEHKV